MTEPWQHQLRLYLSDGLSDIARRNPDDPAFAPLGAVLRRHDATLVCQYDAFADYVAAAEREGEENFPLYKWTKATLDDAALTQKHMRAFAVRVGGAEVYEAAAADALEADLRPLVDGETITRMSRHDTNPANNLPVPEKYR